MAFAAKRKRSPDENVAMNGRGWEEGKEEGNFEIGMAVREEEESTQTPFFLSKRRRETNQEQQLDLNSILQRVVLWLVSNQANLPHTATALCRAITSLCSSVVHISEEIIYYHLLFNGVVLLGGEGDQRVRGNPNPKPFESLVAIVVDSSCANLHLSDDFSLALRRARDWVASNSGLCERAIPLDSFLRSLKQICQFKRSVPATSVVETLTKRGMVYISPYDQSLTYCMDALVSTNQLCKYVVHEPIRAQC